MLEIAHIKLSELTKKIEEHIRQNFGTQMHWIVAEISGHKFYANQDRHYFDWVEKIEGQNVETAKVKGIAWIGGSKNIRNFEEVTSQKFTNGIQVLAQVRVEFHAIHGFSLILTDIDPSFTLGNLERQRRETLLKLVEFNPDAIVKVGEEFITRNKQIPLRAVIQKIALIASPNSEGYNDFIHTMKTNQFGYKFHIDEYQSSVQGAPAEYELVKTLIKIFNSSIAYDCVVIVRGGGAKTDFLVFDTYKVAQAVAKFPIPVITGIGHHKDVSITDLMAHTVTKTPTKSAELIIDHARNFEESLLKNQKKIIIRSQQLLHKNRQEINGLNLFMINSSQLILNKHKEKISQLNQTILSATKTLVYSTKTALSETQQVILNSSRSKFHSFSKELATINQSLLNKTNKILFNANTGLEIFSQQLKNHTFSFLTNSKNKLGNINQDVTGKSRIILFYSKTNFSTLINKISSRASLITSVKFGDLKNSSESIQVRAVYFLSNKNTTLEHHKKLIKAMSPDNILKKGFALLSQNGKVIKNSKTIEVGSKLTITMNDDTLQTKVLSKTK